MGTRDFTLRKTIITDNTSIAPGVNLTRLERKFDFIPGQVIGVTVTKDIPPRLYSLCSGTEDKEFEILYNVVESGLLTPRMEPLQPGEQVYITEPFGSFTHVDCHVNWVAAGTGIAPFISMLRSGITPKGWMVYGARKPENFFFSQMLRSHFNERFIACCSGDCDANDDFYKGRLTTYLSEAEDLKPGEMYYLCGSVDMVIQTREILMQKGVFYDNIRAEIYF